MGISRGTEHDLANAPEWVVETSILWGMIVLDGLEMWESARKYLTSILNDISFSCVDWPVAEYVTPQ